ncbi:hypothetical protein LCGC14_1265480 [marine sediment metagenome]|uniref:Uncharacterized protein n=1 Tax=marine sediment metagenome TaxID=412755 RepID=A0A0F9P2Y1_9ZZZZ|nr:hypothetical protein [Desulfobacterales bacterium]
MRKSSKFKRGCGWISFVCLMLFFGGLTTLVLINISCSNESVVDPRPYETPDMVTAFGINVWLGGYDIDPDEIDEYFLEVVDELNYGPVDPIDLIISPTHCREYLDGLTYCGFEDPDLSFMLAGRFYPPNDIKIHLMNGEWSLGESALDHELRHYGMYYYDVPGWDINSDKPAWSDQEEA